VPADLSHRFSQYSQPSHAGHRRQPVPGHGRRAARPSCSSATSPHEVPLVTTTWTASGRAIVTARPAAPPAPHARTQHISPRALGDQRSDHLGHQVSNAVPVVIAIRNRLRARAADLRVSVGRLADTSWQPEWVNMWLEGKPAGPDRPHARRTAAAKPLTPFGSGLYHHLSDGQSVPISRSRRGSQGTFEVNSLGR
jgi:hypothetical protein